MSGQAKIRLGMTLAELVVVLVILVATAGLVVPLLSGVRGDARYSTTRASMQTLKNAIAAYALDMKGVATYNAQFVMSNTTGVPNSLQDLIVQPQSGTSPGTAVQSFNPLTRLGWRGPYLAGWTGTFTANLDQSFYPTNSAYGLLGGPAQLDGWGNPIVLQWPTASAVVADYPGTAQASQFGIQAQYVRLVSAGPATVVGNQDVYKIVTSNTLLMPTDLYPVATYRGNNLVVFLSVPDPYVANLFPQR